MNETIKEILAKFDSQMKLDPNTIAAFKNGSLNLYLILHFIGWVVGKIAAYFMLALLLNTIGV